MKRLKSIFGIFKFKKPIEVREAFDLQLLEKISLLVTTSLQKQIPITESHPLLHISSKIKGIIHNSHPQKVIMY